MKRTLIAAILALLLTVAGCGKNSDEQALKNAIMANTEAMNDENAEAYMETIYNDGTGLYESTRTVIEDLFKNYDLNSKLLKVEVVEIGDGTAKVRTTTSTSKVSGGQFKNNEAVMLHTMVKDAGVWKIQSTQVENVKYTD